MSLSGNARQILVVALGNRDAAQELSAALDASTGANAVFSASTDATHLGFFGVTVSTRATAYTQTYATATKTHSAPTAVALTNSTGGTPATTFAVIVAPAANATTSLTADMTAVQNALAQTAVSINALIVDVANIKQVVNSIIDDLQLYGLLS
jgi:hypothetical protein